MSAKQQSGTYQYGTYGVINIKKIYLLFSFLGLILLAIAKVRNALHLTCDCLFGAPTMQTWTQF